MNGDVPVCGTSGDSRDRGVLLGLRQSPTRRQLDLAHKSEALKEWLFCAEQIIQP